MDREEGFEDCPECAAPVATGLPCPACGEGRGRSEAWSGLQIVRGGGAPDVRSAVPPPVKVIRQLKLPTTDQLTLDELSAARLTATLNHVEEAIAGDDLVGADELLDRALGTVIAGPGHRRRRSGRRIALILLIAWSLVLFGVLISVLWGGE